MKKEVIYIVVPIVLCIAGFIFKSIFLSDTLDKTRLINETNLELNSRFIRDSLVQNNIDFIKKNYEQNKRDDRTYGEIVADLLKLTENLLQKSNITYKSNDINQEFDEVRNDKIGVTTFYIITSFNTEFINLYNLLTLLEQDQSIINVVNLELKRERVKLGGEPGSSDKGPKEDDEYNVKAKVNVRIRLEFVKFL